MDKTMGLIVTAMVVMVAGVIVVAIGSSSLGDFGDRSSDIGDQGCEFQQQRALNNPDFKEQMSDECRNEDFQQMQREREVVDGAVGILGT